MSATPAIGYATLARLRNGARSKVADVVCPLCSTTRTGAAAGRKILRTWAMESAIGFHCARCDVDGLAFIDEDCMSSEHFGQLAWQFKRMSGSSGLKVQAAIAC